MTDGADNYNPANKKQLYDSWSSWLKELNGVQSRILAIGLSRSHDANQMNQIANYGNEVGNFIFVDSNQEGWQQKMSEAMEESLAIALSGLTKA